MPASEANKKIHGENKMPTEIKSNPLMEKLQEMGLDESPVKLVGYPLVSDRKDKVRLYQDLSLSTYFEFDQDDIVHVSEGESDSEPTVVLVQPQAEVQAVFKQTIKANALNSITDSWRADPNSYGPGCQQIPSLTPLSEGMSSVYSGTAVQLHPKMCRIVPIYDMRPVVISTEFGPQIVTIQTFVGFEMDCSY